MTPVATTRLQEFWPTGEGLTLLGHWCLDESDLWTQEGRARYRIAHYPWDDKARVLGAANEVDGVAERLLSQLADALNGLHQETQDIRFWRIIVGPWLASFLDALYDRFTCLNDLIETVGSIETIGLDDNSFLVPRDFKEFDAALAEDGYNLQLYTKVLGAMGVPMARKTAGIRASTRSPRPARWRPRAAIGRVRRRAENAWIEHAAIVGIGTGFSARTALRLRFATGGRAAFAGTLERRYTAAGPVDSDLRGRLARHLTGTTPFERVACALLPTEMPTAYLEDFAARISDERCRRPPQVVLGGFSWFIDDDFKFLAARAYESGSRLVAMQHGGYYGMLATHTPERHEQRVADKFCSWGWEDGLAPGRTVRAMPSVALTSSAAITRAAKPQGILFVTTMHPRYLYRFQGHPVSAQWREYVLEQERLLVAMAPGTRSDVTLRLYPSDYGWGLQEFWQSRFPALRVERAHPPMANRYRSIGLLVVDHPGTTVLQAMAANVPQVLFWNPERFVTRPGAEGALNALRSAGVLVSSPEEAARRIEEIRRDPESWWRSADVQRARNTFSVTFARTETDWAAIWCQELQRGVDSTR